MTIEPIELHTERLLLRPFQPTDVDDVYAYAVDPEWQRYVMNIPRPYTRAHAQEFIGRNLSRDWETNPNLAIVLDGRVVGSTGLVVSKERRSAEIGYSLARAHWGKGLASEAARVLIDWGFSTYDLAKIHARADARNQRSSRVMEKLGMTREGLLRKHRLTPDGRADEVVYGLLREEWEASR